MTMRYAKLGNKALLERAGAKGFTDAIDSGDLTSGGRLNPEQADRFIDYVVDQSVLFKDGIRVRRMNSDRAQLDKLQVGTRILRKATEGTDPGTVAGIATAQRQLSVTELILPVDITFSFMEDNIERDNFEQHVMAMFGIQLSNDLEDLGINGDGVTTPFLSIEKGWLQIIKDEVASPGPNETAPARFDTNAATDFRNVIFPGMLALLPSKFKANKSALRFYVSVGNAEAYQFQIGQRQTMAGDAALLVAQNALTYGGIPVVGATYMPDSNHLLTLPDNLVFGVRRDVSLGIFKNERKRVWEYTWTLRVDYEIVEPTAIVIGYNF